MKYSMMNLAIVCNCVYNGVLTQKFWKQKIVAYSFHFSVHTFSGLTTSSMITWIMSLLMILHVLHALSGHLIDNKHILSSYIFKNNKNTSNLVEIWLPKKFWRNTSSSNLELELL